MSATDGNRQQSFPPPPTFKSLTSDTIREIASGRRFTHPYLEDDACPLKKLRYRLGFSSLWLFSEWIVPTDGPELDAAAQAINLCEHARADTRNGKLRRVWQKFEEAGHPEIKAEQQMWLEQQWANRKAGRR